MSRREDIDSSVWSDPEFLDLGPTAKLVYVWSFTNERTGMAGIYKVVRPAIVMETGLDADLDDALAELEQHRFAFYDGRVMWVRTRVKHLRQKSWSIAKAIERDLQRVGDHPYAARFWEQNANETWLAHTAPTPPADPPQAPSTPPAKPRAKRAPAPPDPDRFPADLPERLVKPAETVLTVLARVADAKGAKPVTKAAVGRALVARPHHDHAQIAGEFEHYWVHGTGAAKPMMDVVATFRNRLSNLPEQKAAALAGAMRGIQSGAESELERFRAHKAKLAEADNGATT